MHVNVIGGYLIPSEKLVPWWNRQAPPDRQLPLDDPGDGLLSMHLTNKFGRDKEGFHTYIPQILWFGPKEPEGLRKSWIFISCDALTFLDVPPEQVKACRTPQNLENERTAQLRKFLEEDFGLTDVRFKFEENDVRWHNRRYIC